MKRSSPAPPPGSQGMKKAPRRRAPVDAHDQQDRAEGQDHEGDRSLHDRFDQTRAHPAMAPVAQDQPACDGHVQDPVVLRREREAHEWGKRLDQMGAERDLAEVEDHGDRGSAHQPRHQGADKPRMTPILGLDNPETALAGEAGHGRHHEQAQSGRQPDQPQGAIPEGGSRQHRRGEGACPESERRAHEPGAGEARIATDAPVQRRTCDRRQPPGLSVQHICRNLPGDGIADRDAVAAVRIRDGSLLQPRGAVVAHSVSTDLPKTSRAISSAIASRIRASGLAA